MEEIVEKYVRINALTPLYGRVPYTFAAVRKQNGQFLTGQESIITEKQMIGEEPLTKKNIDELQMGDNPYIINPNIVYTLRNGRKFDLSYKEVKGKRIYLNPKDYAEYTFFEIQPEVIKTKKGFQKNKHFFYIEDKEAEARSKVTFQDKQFQANAFVREDTSIKRLKDIAILVSHISSYNINPDVLTITQLQSRLYDVCNTSPESILACLSDDDNNFNEERLFAIKCIRLKEIRHENGAYYYGVNNTYVGENFNKVLEWIRDPKNSSAVERLGRLVKEEEDKDVE